MIRLLAQVFALCPILHAAELTGEEIIRSALEASHHQEVLRQQFVYHEHQENGPAKPDGTPAKVRITRDFEVIFLEGDFYRKLVAVDGKPLKAKQAQEEEEKMRMTAVERKAKHPVRKGLHTGVPLSTLVSVMDHKLLREEEVGGRKYWVVQSEPKKDAAPKTLLETQALSYRYTHWIDELEHAVFRKEWEVIGAGVDMKPGSTTKLLFGRNAEGAWLLQRADLLILNGDKLGGNRFFQTNVFSDFRRFTTETNVHFDDDPPL